MDGLVPLSVLQLDLPLPSTGCGAFLAERHIPVRLDDLGRESATREAARRLFVEARELEVRQREKAERLERQAIEADQRWREQLPRGVPANATPEGYGTALAIAQAQAVNEARGHRVTPLEEALGNTGTLTYHPIQQHEDDER